MMAAPRFGSRQCGRRDGARGSWSARHPRNHLRELIFRGLAVSRSCASCAQAVFVANHRRIACHRPLQIRPRQRTSKAQTPAAAPRSTNRRPKRVPQRPFRPGRRPRGPRAELLEANRFAPCIPVRATSPAAKRPANSVRPCTSVTHTAAAVVRTGDDGDGLTCRIDARLPARRGDRGEPLLESLDAACVEVNAGVDRSRSSVRRSPRRRRRVVPDLPSDVHPR